MEEKSNIGFIESCDVPTVYSNKQSYYEVLCYINYKLNEVIDLYNSFEMDYKTYVDSQLDSVKRYADDVGVNTLTKANDYTKSETADTLTTAKEYSDSAKKLLDDKIQIIIADVNSLTTSVLTNADNIRQEIIDRKTEDSRLGTNIETLRTESLNMITTLRKLIDVTSDVQAVFFDNKLLELKTYIDEHYIRTITANNPWRGKVTDAQTIINDVFSVYRPLSMSVSEIESVLPEVINIDEYKTLSVGDFDFNGLRVKQYLSDAYVHSMVTGKYVTIHQAYYELAKIIGLVQKNPFNSSNNETTMASSAYSDVMLLDSGAFTDTNLTGIDLSLNDVNCYYASMNMYECLTL